MKSHNNEVFNFYFPQIFFFAKSTFHISVYSLGTILPYSNAVFQYFNNCLVCNGNLEIKYYIKLEY